MKSWVACLAVVSSLSPVAAAAHNCASSPQIRVMSYNIRLDIEADGASRWTNRRAMFTSQVELAAPAIAGFQEVLPNQRADLEAALPGYRFIGGGRDDGALKGEASPLAVDRAIFKVGANGMFWLSPTPDQPSLGWGASYRRVASWAHLTRRGDGLRLLAINTHWDHEAVEARRNSAAQLRAWIAVNLHKGEVVVLLGDFNAPLGEESMRSLLDPQSGLMDSRLAAGTRATGGSISFNGFDPFPKSGTIIDHILFDDGLSARRYHLLAEHFDGRVASDHFPVIADLVRSCKK